MHALAEQVAHDDLIIVVNSDDGVSSALSARLAERLPDARILRERQPGLALARDRALADIGDQDVIAFVDDDVVIGPGWYASLRLAWDKAAPDIGCIGGTIRPRFLRRPPDG